MGLAIDSNPLFARRLAIAWQNRGLVLLDLRKRAGRTEAREEPETIYVAEIDDTQRPGQGGGDGASQPTEERDDDSVEQDENPPTPDSELVSRFGDPVFLNANGVITGINFSVVKAT